MSAKNQDTQHKKQNLMRTTQPMPKERKAPSPAAETKRKHTKFTKFTSAAATTATDPVIRKTTMTNPLEHTTVGANTNKLSTTETATTHINPFTETSTCPATILVSTGETQAIIKSETITEMPKTFFAETLTQVEPPTNEINTQINVATSDRATALPTIIVTADFGAIHEPETSTVETNNTTTTSEMSTNFEVVKSETATTQAPFVSTAPTETIRAETLEASSGHVTVTVPMETEALIEESTASTQALTTSEVSTNSQAPSTTIAITEASVEQICASTASVTTTDQSTLLPATATINAKTQQPLMNTADTTPAIVETATTEATASPNVAVFSEQMTVLTSDQGTHGLVSTDASTAQPVPIMSDNDTQGVEKTEVGTVAVTEVAAVGT